MPSFPTSRTAFLRTSCALVALSLLPLLTACEYRRVTVRIADFESALVEGVRFWRLTEASLQFEPGGSVEFDDPRILESGHEVVDYTVFSPDGEELVTLPAFVLRNPADPDTVTLELQYLRYEDPGWFRITTYNAAGESELSQEQIYL